MSYLSAREFSKLTHTPIDTIKHYDRIGILKPAFVGENKYRYYLPEQALELTRIIFSSRAKINLKSLQKVIKSNDCQSSINQYLEIYNTLGDEIDELDAIRDCIRNLKYWYQLSLQHSECTLFSIYLPEWFMIYSPKLDIASSDISNDSNLANELFFKAFYNKRWPHYQLGAFYETASIKNRNFNDVAFFIKTDHPEEYDKNELLLNPTGSYLCYFAYRNGKEMVQTVKDYLNELQKQNLNIIGNIYVTDIVN
ncbi:MAG: MerR family transcriptional regulator, partial [Phascolarctobacterium sp.]|nr:MerR family transcriptional regulator [Phascolarctobacterium sp.]